MFQQEFFAYFLDTKKAISLKASLSILRMEAFGITSKEFG